MAVSVVLALMATSSGCTSPAREPDAAPTVVIAEPRSDAGVHDAVPAPGRSPEAHPKAQGGSFTCAMHPQVRAPEAGTCPICGMDLVPISDDEAAP